MASRLSRDRILHRRVSVLSELLESRGAVASKIFQSKILTGAAVVAALVVLLAVFADLICAINGADPFTYHLDELSGQGVPLAQSSWNHWFGVEPQTGRDLFAIVAFGARTSLIVGLGATLLDLAIGVLVGVTSGFLGGKPDAILSKFTDLNLLFPGLIFMIALSSVVPDWFPRYLLMILIIGLFGWGGIARVVRSETLRLKQEEYIIAAWVAGAKPARIIFRHLLPNLLGTVIVFGAISIPAKIATEATLSFLGVGITAPTPSWGRSISEAINWIYVDPMFLIYPASFLFAITLAFNLFGDKLRDILDPNLGAPVANPELADPNREVLDAV